MKLHFVVPCAVALLTLAGLAQADPAQAQTSAPATAAPAPAAVGDWQGSITTPNGALLVNVQLTANNGGVAGLMETPEIAGAPATPLVVTEAGPRLAFNAPTISGSFEAEWDAALGGWSGHWSQSGYRLPLVLRPAPPRAAPVPGLDGVWNGGIERDGRRFRMILRVTTDARGTHMRFDAPDGGAENLPATDFTREGDRVRFTVPAAGARFDGVVEGDRLTGDWLFPGRPTARIEFDRTRAPARSAAASRPQTPVTPPPYRVEEVRITRSQAPEVTLGATLTIPDGPGPFPGVVLVSGSGQHDRDGTMFGHKPFAVLADHLTRQGIVVLRYDDRGVGASTGSYPLSTPLDFAADANAALSYLARRPEVEMGAVGFISHSEGGLTSAIAAATNPDLDFLVLMASPGMPMRDVMLAQRRLIGVAGGARESDLIQSEPIIANVLDTIAHAGSDDDAEAGLRTILTADRLAALGMGESDKELFIQQMARSGIRHSLLLDPTQYLARTLVPVLALSGGLDLQVPPDVNLAAIKSALSSSRDVTILKLEGLNHLFQTAQTGGVAEYARIEETFSPAAMEIIVDWIGEVASASGALEPR